MRHRTWLLLILGCIGLALFGGRGTIARATHPCAWLGHLLVRSPCVQRIAFESNFNVNALRFATDRQTILVAGGYYKQRGELQVRHIADGALLHTISTTDMLLQLAVLPRSGRLLSVDSMGTVYLWDSHTFAELRRFTIPTVLSSQTPSIANDERLVAFYTSVWQLEDGSTLGELSHREQIARDIQKPTERLGQVWSHDGTWSACTNRCDEQTMAPGGSPVILSHADGTQFQTFAGPVDALSFLLVSPDDRALAAVYRTWYEQNSDNYQTWLRIWRVQSGELVLARDLALEIDPTLHPCVWSPDGHQFAVSGFFGPVDIYQIP